MIRGKVVTVVAACLGLAAVCTPAGATGRTERTAVSASGQLRIVGDGFGHGRGMSQWGAYGRAKAGQSHQQILGFYYPGATPATASGAMRVLISADTTPGVVVAPVAGLRVHAVGGATYPALVSGATAYRLVPSGSRTSVQYLAKGDWHVERWVSPVAEWVSDTGALTLRLPDGSATYRGRLRTVSHRTVNVVDLESYLDGVVAAEMPASWSAQALQAQAVAARTYAWAARHRNADDSYDTCDTSSCQVYGGVAAQTSSTDAAVAATRGQILSYRGAPAFTEFSASNGGTTAGWLTTPPKRDPYDTAYRHWSATLSVGSLRSARWGAPTAVTLTHDASGRVTSALLSYGSQGSRTMSGDALRSAYGLRSTLFSMS